MAEKGFGVKEVNLIGASGTPTITSPNNLNLSAVNVAISTNATVGGTLSVTGNVSIGGTLTYEDVTNVDSVGVVTAREGIKIPDDKEITFGAGGDGFIKSDGANFLIQGGGGGTGTTYVRGRTLRLSANGGSGGFNGAVTIDKSGDERVQLKYGNSTKLVTTNTGLTVTGTLVATTFSGSGASLTSLPAANLTGTLPAISGANLTNLPIDPADTDPQVVFDVSASGSSGYIFTGPGNDGSTVDPDIFLIRGQRYRFINTTGSSHPFEFRNSDNSADYTDGITGSQSGTQDFNVQYDAPSHLKYRCTIHSGMIGNIYIRSGADTGASAGTGNLEVDGFIRFDNTVSKILTDTSDGSDDKAILITGGGDTATSRGALAILHGNELNSGRLDLYSGVGGGAITFNTGSTTTERLRITSDGKVGINSTSPSNTLVVQEPTDNNSSIQLFRASTGGDIASINWATNQGNQAKINYRGAAPSGMQFYTGGGASSNLHMLIDPNGRVGIGTDEPGFFTHIQADGVTGDVLKLTATASGQMMNIQNKAGSSYPAIVRFASHDGTGFWDLQYNNNDNSFSFDKNDSEKLRIASTGELGLGLTQDPPTGSFTMRLTETPEFNIYSTQHAQNNNCKINFGIGQSASVSGNTGARIEMNIPNAGGQMTGDLIFHTNSGDNLQERLRINSSGQVGINTTTHADTASALSIMNGASASEHTIFDIRCNDNETSRIYFSEVSTSANGSIRYRYTGDDRYMSFYTNGSSSSEERLRISKTGNLEVKSSTGNSALIVNTTASASTSIILNTWQDNSNGRNWAIRNRYNDHGRLEIMRSTANDNDPLTAVMSMDRSGNIGAPNGTNIYNASDIRLKKNVTTLDKGLECIKSLRPVSFNWIDGFCDDEKETMYGFIAQEVRTVDSNLIEKFGGGSVEFGDTKIEDTLRVKEKQVIPLLVKAIQELSTKNDELEARIKTLEGS